MKRKKEAKEDSVTTEQPQAEPEGGAVLPTEVLSEEEQAASIEDRILELEKELEAERAQALRVLADFQNFRRRSEEQRAETASRAVQEFVTDLLPILDNFERALASAADSRSFDGLVAGVELILRQLRELLQKHGVEPIEAVGQPFDPNLHDAAMRVEDAEVAENTVVEELQRGYTMDGRVIRPAMVKVATRP